MSHEPSSPQPQHDHGLQLAADLRGASDHLLQRLDRLYELEQRKRELLPDNPEFVRLAREVQDVARAVLGDSGAQVNLATQVADRARRGETSVDHAIRDIPPGPRDAMLILSEWRAAERRLSEAGPDSDEERAARADVERLRHEYGDAINLRGSGDLGKL